MWLVLYPLCLERSGPFSCTVYARTPLLNQDAHTFHHPLKQPLQPYSFRKRLEHSIKAMVYDGMAISVIDPHRYASRFLKMAGRLFGTWEPSA